jgi:DNA-binding LacI/PurR family transcriptional regulator
MPTAEKLQAVHPEPGRPLYQTVMDAVITAIDGGMFAPGEQMPNTKYLSEAVGVSLVTAHRALQELVTAGVLERSQGRGTFVHHRYQERRKIAPAASRVGLVFHREASLADYYHGQILEGVHQAAGAGQIDLIMLRFGEDIRNECSGYLFVNPFPEDMEKFVADLKSGKPGLIVGAQSVCEKLAHYDVDNMLIARLAVEHLAKLGHEHIGYVGGAYKISNSRDRWLGFNDACKENKVGVCESHLVKGAGWHLADEEITALAKMLASPDRPTAIFAAGYSFALDVYDAAAKAGLRIPQDLSVIGVDDPPGADHLAPPMTTIRQPLVDLGKAALSCLSHHIQSGSCKLDRRRFDPVLIERNSTAAPA